VSTLKPSSERLVADGLQKPSAACLSLVTAHNFGAAPSDIVRVAGGVVTDLKRA
jgi:hypothetical protein